MDSGTLPETFTVCSSIYVEYLTTFLNFFAIKDVSVHFFSCKYISCEIAKPYELVLPLCDA